MDPEEREKVKTTLDVPMHKCCTSPYWLYRIYQDTIVDLTEVSNLIVEGLVESKKNVLANLDSVDWHRSKILPLPVSDMFCMDYMSNRPGELWVAWYPPWNNAKVVGYDVHVLNSDQVYSTVDPRLGVSGFETGEKVRIRIRARTANSVGEYGRLVFCMVQ